MDVKEKVEAIRLDREEAIGYLRRGEFGFAELALRKIVRFMPEEFARQVTGHFAACNYTRVADLVEHKWKVVEVPANEEASTSGGEPQANH